MGKENKTWTWVAFESMKLRRTYTAIVYGLKMFGSFCRVSSQVSQTKNNIAQAVKLTEGCQKWEKFQESRG